MASFSCVSSFLLLLLCSYLVAHVILCSFCKACRAVIDFQNLLCLLLIVFAYFAIVTKPVFWFVTCNFSTNLDTLLWGMLTWLQIKYCLATFAVCLSTTDGWKPFETLMAMVYSFPFMNLSALSDIKNHLLAVAWKHALFVAESGSNRSEIIR